MSQTTFEDRLMHLGAKAAIAPEPPAPQRGRGPGKPSFLVTFLIGFVFVLVGFAGAFIVKLALDPEMTPDAALYTELMLLAGAFLILMLGSAVAALVARLRRPILNRVALFTLASYGIMSAMLDAAIT